MKKLLLSFGLFVATTYSFGQVICNQTSPNPTVYSFTQASGWGMDMSIPGNFVHDTIAVASDTLGCTTISNSVSGKIAVIYRGSCNFTVKVENAAAAGAVGVIIVNNVATAPITMGGTPTGPISIPAVMISQADGASVRATMTGGPVKFYIGNKSGFFANDLALTDIGSMRANVGSLPISLAQNGTEFSVPLGAWVFNQGQNDLTNIVLNATINRDGTEVHNVNSSPASIVAGDSMFFTLTTYSPATHQAGDYEITYSVSSGATDDYTSDNTNTNYFSLSDSLWSLCSLDTTVVTKQTYVRPATLPTTEFESCIAFKNTNAGRVAMDGVYFGGFFVSTADSATVHLDDFEAFWSLYTWDDADFTISNGSFDILSQVAFGQFTYPSNGDPLAGETIFMPLTGGDQGTSYYRFTNDQQYLLCIENFQPKLFMAYSERDHYDQQIDSDDLVRFPNRSDVGDFTPAGFVGLPVPSIAIRTGATLSVSENELVDASAFPVPAKETITVKVNAAGNATLKIVDMAGRQVSTQQVKIENGQFQTSVAGMNAGTYVFTLDYSNGTTSRFNVVVSK
ncbi:PA domain-containing protein [Fluviicola chungangensis]|uniref:T9SS type A sorting domain-containing protein n=1 Tax=Fluviicola chungangensis TaxID=2597671 RepID=A0A556N2H3_9FLAO|nr:PA domain-containing protein [Fluviicola chungangensis]TSJ46400.1 T9SS type A sorting domain-containing protein [Fluviicola chungangensis]